MMKKSINIFLINFINPIMGICGFNYLLGLINNNEIFLNNYFISFIVFIMLAFIYNREFIKEKIIKRYVIFSLFFSLILSFVLILGLELEIYSSIIWTPYNFINCLFLILFVFPIVYFIIKRIESIDINVKELNFKHKKLLAFCVIFVFSFLVYLALYPGVYGYDSINQVDRIYKGYMNTHYSVLFCVIIGYMVKLGENIFNSYQIGVGIFVFIQIIALSLVTSNVVVECYNYTKNKIVYWIVVSFYCIFTFYKIMVVSVAQDVLFSAFFTLIFIKLFRISTDKEKFLRNKFNYVFLATDILMLCFLRNNGLYAILFTVPFLLLIKGKEKIFVICSFIIPLIIYKVIYGPVFGVLNIKSDNDGIKEALSIPTQQLSRVYVYNKSAFDEENLKNFQKYYNDIDGLESYKIGSSISDAQKNHINKEGIKNDLIGYIKFYIKIGIKDTKDYIDAFLLNSLGAWYPNKTYPDTRMYHPLIEYDMTPVNDSINTGFIGVDRNSKNLAYENVLNWLVKENNWQKIPVFSTLYTLGFYFLSNMFMIGVVIMRKQWKLLIPTSLIVGLYITIFLAPVALFRYCFPIIICTPLVFIVIINKNFNNKGEEDGKNSCINTMLQ